MGRVGGHIQANTNAPIGVLPRGRGQVSRIGGRVRGQCATAKYLRGGREAAQTQGYIPGRAGLAHRHGLPLVGQQIRDHLFHFHRADGVNEFAQTAAEIGFQRLEQGFGLFHGAGLGRDAYVGLAGVGGQTDGRVAQFLKVADAGVNQTLAHTDGAQHAAADDGWHGDALAQIGQHRVFEHIFQFARHTGQCNDRARGVFDNEAGGRADRVFQRQRPSGHISLLAVVFGGLAAKTEEARLDLGP